MPVLPPRVHLMMEGPGAYSAPRARGLTAAPLRPPGQSGAGAPPAPRSPPVPAHPQVKLLGERVNVEVAGAGVGVCEAVPLRPDRVEVIVCGLGQVAVLLANTGHGGDEADVIPLLHACNIIIVRVIIVMVIIITITTWSLVISERVTVITWNKD